jgi:hypothetical protein
VEIQGHLNELTKSQTEQLDHICGSVWGPAADPVDFCELYTRVGLDGLPESRTEPA